MSIRIIEPGISATLQDKGRKGYASLGINPGGVMDPVAAATANYLVGNSDDAAVLELHFPAPVLQFDVPVLLAIAGADFSPVIDGIAVPVNTPVMVPAGAVLQFVRLRQGARAYIAIKDGLQADKWLGSYSTNTKAGAGGYKGRALRKDDVIGCGSFDTGGGISWLPWHADRAGLYHESNTIRMVKGAEYHLLTECSGTIIEGNTFRISPHSDRMGYRLNGSPLQAVRNQPMISSAVTKGAIQLLPDGELIILMADHQTTGGYPRIGHVITADIPRLAQMPVHTVLRFTIVAIEEAETLLLRQHHHLQQLKNACTFRLQQYLQQHVVRGS